MIYKQITFRAAMQMVVEDDIKILFFENDNGLCRATEVRYSLTNLKNYKWFKQIPEEVELQKIKKEPNPPDFREG